MYLSTVLDDFSRYIIAWKLCANMRAEDVTDTLDLALAAYQGEFRSSASDQIETDAEQQLAAKSNGLRVP
jgi:transposase InsO family protein